MPRKTRRLTRPASALALVAAGALLATGYRSAAQPASKTAPLAGATAVRQDPSCKGYKTYSVPRVAPLDPRKTYQATVVTNKGSFVITFLPKEAPVTVESFIFLAQRHYFDGVPFHRVLPGFVIQGGDPTGTGGCGPGYQFKDENLNHTYKRGAIAMANAGPNTNGSQFFVVLKDKTFLDQSPNYSLFGQVTSGMSAVDRIAGIRLGNRDVNGQPEKSVPLEKVYMKSVRISVR